MVSCRRFGNSQTIKDLKIIQTYEFVAESGIYIIFHIRFGVVNFFR